MTIFQFKASFSPCTILQLNCYDLEGLEKQLPDTIKHAPNLFLGAPIIIDLEKIKNVIHIDFAAIKKILIKIGLVPVAVRNVSELQGENAMTAGLPQLAGAKAKSWDEKKSDDAKPSDENHAKIITYPVRSGTQIYAKESDLIVVAQVSPGSELLADGNIHVYGALRGRALAGVKGNTKACIFCCSLDAELVSIAGYYITQEDIHHLKLKTGVLQIYLEDEQVRIKSI